MKTGYGFTEFETLNEFKSWLNKQNVTRKVTRLQVHHMWMPDYSCWPKDNPLRRQKNTKDYHINHNKWGNIAQHFSIFPDGHIVTGRSLNSTPIGITGWNTNAICVEIYGNFDKGKDIMTKAQKGAVIYLYGELCKRFKIPVDTAHIRPHCWFTAGGTYLGKYNSSRSAKTCPGTNFMGHGCSPSGFNKFLADIKEYVNGKEVQASPTDDKFKPYIARVNTNGLNARKGPGTEYDIECILNKGIAVTVIAEVKAKDSGTWCKCKAGYYTNKKYMEFVRYV